jgi:hypothetical protein
MAPTEQNELSVEDIEAKIAELTLLRNQRVEEAENKKSKKDKKKAAKKLDVNVKVPKAPPILCLTDNRELKVRGAWRRAANDRLVRR